MFFELLHPRAALSGTQFQYSVPRLEYGNSILARTKKLFPEIKPESRSKILFNLAWEAVKPLYNDKTDIHKSCQTSLNDAKKDIVIVEEENVQTIVGEFGSMIETDNNLSSDFTVEDTLMASKLRTIVSSTFLQLPVSSIINTSPLQPFGAIPPKLSSTPTSGKCVHSVITIQTPPLSSSPQASSITSSVILPSSQSSITMLPSQTFSMMQHSPSSQKFAVMLSLPLYQTSVAIVSSPLIHTSAVTVSSPLLQTATVIVSSPLLQTAAVIVSSPLLQIAAVIVSSPLLQPAAAIVSSPLLQTSAVNLLSPLLQTSAVNLLSQLLQTSFVILPSPSIQTSSSMLPSPPISAGMVTSLFSQTSQTSAVTLSSQSLPPLWIEPETKAVQYISSQFTTQPDQLTCHSTQQYIPIINIRNISFDHTDNGNVKVLGKGATAEVLQGNLHSVCSLKKVAIKLYNDQHKDVHYISQEAGILQILNNSYVTPKVFGIIENNSFPLCLVQELIESSTELYQLFSVPSVSHSAWLQIALNICNSLKTIHDAYVLVNDIKTDNIMVNTQDLSIKFIDMGHASHKGGRSFYLPVEEAYRYPHMGPEISSGHLTTKATDIFSLGYLLTIFPASPLKTIGHMCLNPCPAQRPPIEEIIDKISEHMK